ncbi:hypothetical protein K1T71_013446 [Dendrolimus kikuchii]|uniref:Uncharacterized protein n=1 Tax=Dendrolimus kikuchii TaxID=765133 RepID=A0ACC1CGH6_9NEOP|nr:hypothetical protein K1T71_013446 [Dendrolimus kikuchii]
MAEKNIQENPLPEEPQEQSQPQELQLQMPAPMGDPKEIPKPLEVPKPDKPAPTPPPVTIVPPPLTIPYTKSPPNDLYRRLLPAVLFVLTFVTVMTMLLVYMDNVAMTAQQFRRNMTLDYELARIGQASAQLVAYVRQLHLSPPHAAHPPLVPQPTRQVHVIDALYGQIYNGTFIEFLPRGGRDQTMEYLEGSRHWEGVVVRAAPKDYLLLRGGTRALHACLSPTAHPREVTYQEPDSQDNLFSSRVLCLPLYTVLLAAEATKTDYVLLGGNNVLPALKHIPFEDGSVRLQVIEIRSSDPIARNRTTAFLATKNYFVAASFDEGVMYALKETV